MVKCSFNNPSASFLGTSLYTREAKDSCHVCGGGATTASGVFFDEPIGSACGMPQGGYRKPPARLVVMTFRYVKINDIVFNILLAPDVIGQSF